MDLETLRQRRAELRESLDAVEHALAASPVGQQERWATRVHVALVELAADFREHVHLTEAADGLYTEVLRKAPRLSGQVARLTREHEQVTALLEDLVKRAEATGDKVDVDRIRGLGIALLGRLVRHRQRGADLLFETYEVDIGGET